LHFALLASYVLVQNLQSRRQKNTYLRKGYRASRDERSFASVSTETTIGKDMFIERFNKRRRTRGKKDERIRKGRELRKMLPLFESSKYLHPSLLVPRSAHCLYP